MANQLPLDLGPSERTWSVSELGSEVQRVVRAAFRSEIWVKGELRNLRSTERNGKRHLYFHLVQPGGGLHGRPDAAVGVVLWDEQRRQVNAALTAGGPVVKMDEGVEIRIRARVEWWRRSGDLRLVMQAIDPAFTIGRLAEDRERLLRELSASGLLRANAARAVPQLPLRVGLVTAEGSAAETDVFHELEASGFGFTVLAADAPVQGPLAPAAIARGIALLAARAVDVVVVARGGGARTDLAAFDHPLVARAIARCPVPVFCGIGHEIDRSVADEVAHTSAKTPTAAAAAVVELVRAACNRLDAQWSLVAQRIDEQLVRSTRQLDMVAERAAARVRSSLDRAASRCAVLEQRAFAIADGRLRAESARLAAASARLPQLARGGLDRADDRLRHLQRTSSALDPSRLLARGWSITRDGQGELVRSVTCLEPGDVLFTTLAGGTVESRVERLGTTLDAMRPDPLHESDGSRPPKPQP